MFAWRRRDFAKKHPEAAKNGIWPIGFDLPPDLWPENERYLQAFNSLSPRRICGADVGPIPLTEVVAYADLIGIGDRETLMRRVVACDDAWLDFHKAPK